MTEYTEWIEGHPVHPVACLLPKLDEKDLQDLADDIKANGQRDAITLAWLDAERTERVVVDGRNRFAACQLAGVPPVVETDESIKPDDIDSWIMSKNVHRRHLNPSQLAVVALGFKEYAAAAAKKRQAAALRRGRERSEDVSDYGASAIINQGSTSSDEAAAMVGASGRTLRDVEYIAKTEPEVLDKIMAGEAYAKTEATRIRKEKKAKAEPDPPKKEEPDVMLTAKQIKQLGKVLSEGVQNLANYSESLNNLNVSYVQKDTREAAIAELQQARKNIERLIQHLKNEEG